jgi:hypothetical protein
MEQADESAVNTVTRRAASIDRRMTQPRSRFCGDRDKTEIEMSHAQDFSVYPTEFRKNMTIPLQKQGFRELHDGSGTGPWCAVQLETSPATR